MLQVITDWKKSLLEVLNDDDNTRPQPNPLKPKSDTHDRPTQPTRRIIAKGDTSPELQKVMDLAG